MRRVILLVIVGAAVIWAVVARMGGAPGAAPVVVAVDSSSVGLRAVPLWFASAEGDSLVSEPREMPEQAEPHARITALIAALEQGPHEGGMRVLPEGTQLLHAYLDDAGILTLDLSRTFRQGFHGGARAEELAIGSIVRTVAAGVPEAKKIRIVCGGVAVASLGGHFPLDQPLDPDDWP